MRRMMLLSAALAFAAWAGSWSASASAQVGGLPGRQGAPGAGATLEPEAAPDKPDAAATKAYKAGVKAFDKAREYDAAAAANADKRAKQLEKADDAYSRALDEFTEALANKGDMVEAWNYAGAIHLRLGAFVESVDDFDHALKLKADLYTAVESRAEACLALDRPGDAKSGYMDLSVHSPGLADKLMRSMQQWLKVRREDPKGVRAADLDALDQWMKERSAAPANRAPSG